MGSEAEIPPARVDLIAGPAAASPPLVIGVMLVALSVAGPFIFVSDGTPSLLLGITALAVAVAGMITMLAAIRAQLRRRADALPRVRVRISPAGIVLYPSRDASDQRHFAWEHVAGTQLAPGAFIVQAGPTGPQPGRHAIRFGRLVTPRSAIISAIDAFRPKVQPHDAAL